MPHPLHPAVVHFPIVLASLLPLVALAALLAITRGGASPRAWIAVVALGGALALSSWAALETGEEEEDTVEGVVSNSVIHEHEEAAEGLMITSGIIFLALAVGMAPGRIGVTARLLSTPASLVLVFMAFRVGGSGGELVYEHGAAAAYVSPSVDGGEHRREGERRERHSERGEH